MHTLKNILLCTLSSLLVSCTNDQPVEQTPELDMDKLQGRWELTTAYRNNRLTETLAGTYYLFNEDQVTTNLTPDGQERTYHFKRDKDHIRLQDETDFMTFEIDSLNDSLLQMRTEIRGFKFLLALKKQFPDSTIHSATTDSVEYY